MPKFISAYLKNFLSFKYASVTSKEKKPRNYTTIVHIPRYI